MSYVYNLILEGPMKWKYVLMRVTLNKSTFEKYCAKIKMLSNYSRKYCSVN